MEGQGINPYQAPQSQVEDVTGGMPGEKLTLMQIWFSFQGRLSRKPYWLFVSIPLGVVNRLDRFLISTPGLLWLGLIVSLCALWPALAAMTKRLHDRDKSAWWLLLLLVPVIGWLWLIIELAFFRGTNGENRFGGDATDLY